MSLGKHIREHEALGLREEIIGLVRLYAPQGGGGDNYTDEDAQDAVGAALTDTATIDLTYDDTNNRITADVVPGSLDSSYISDFTEAAQDAVGAALTDTAEIDFTYNDGLATITADLKVTTVVAGSYGSTTQVGTFTVDSKGRLTAAANASISITGIGGVPSSRTLTHTQPVAGFTIATASQDLSSDRTWTYTLANDLAALEGLGSTGIAVRSASDTWVQRSIVVGSASLTISNGDGVSGNPSLDTAQNIQTTASPTFVGATFSGLTASLPVVTDGSKNLASMSYATLAGNLDHGLLTGLSDDDHAQYALLAGRAGGQTLVGGTASGEDLTLSSTANATKGSVFIGSSALFEFDQTAGQLKLPTTGTGGGLFLGTTWGLYNRTSNIAATQSGDSLEVAANLAVGTVINSAALVNLTATVNNDSTNQYAVFGQLTGAPTANTANRVFGMSFTAIGSTNFNYTDTTGGLTGLQMAIQHTGSGTITVGNAAILSGTSTSTGTFTTLHMLYALGYDVSSGATITDFHGVRSDMPRASGGGVVTTADAFFASPRTVSSATITTQGFFNTNSSGLNAYSANGQVRYGLRLPTMPSVGAFTGTTTASVWIGYNGTPTAATDGIAFGSGLDVLIYRSGSAALSVTGSITGSSSIAATTTVTAPTSVLTPLVVPATAVTLTLRGFDGVLSGGSSVLLRGGDTSASGGVGGSVSIRAGVAGPMGGTAGTVKAFEPDGTTEVYGITDGLGLVVNEGGDSLVDFRVESDTLTHALFVDSSADQVYIGQSSGSAQLDVALDARARQLIADGSSGGTASTNTFTNGTDGVTATPIDVFDSTATGLVHTGYIRVFVGTQEAWVPYMVSAG